MARQFARMKAGVVVQIRVPPADVMTCIDLARGAGLYMQGMSLPQVVSVALRGLCEHARNTGHAPTRDGFEFDRMTAPFVHAGPHSRKMAITKEMETDAARRLAYDEEPREAVISHMMGGRTGTPTSTKPAPLTRDEQARLQHLAAMRGEAVLQGILEKDWDAQHPDLAREFYALEARL